MQDIIQKAPWHKMLLQASLVKGGVGCGLQDWYMALLHSSFFLRPLQLVI